MSASPSTLPHDPTDPLDLTPATDPPTVSPRPNPSRPASGRPQPAAGRRGRRWLVPLLALLVVVPAVWAVGKFVIVPQFFATARADLLLHKVRPELLPVSVVERGTLESAENREVVCKVKAGSKGTFASTIKWVIDDGSAVSKGQLLMTLDDSALQDSYRNQQIAVEKARAEFIKSDEEYKIQIKTNETLIAQAHAALRMAELDLDKFLGMRAEPALAPLGAVAGSAATVTEKGEFRQRLDDVSARLKQEESNLEAYRDRSAWADRMVKLGNYTESQGRVEQSKLESSRDNVAKLGKEKFILETFLREKELTDLRSKLDVAVMNLEKETRSAHAKEVQTESVRKTNYSVYQQELEKLKENEDQIAECKLYAPQDGMVVYYMPEQGRGSSSQQGLIAQGEQVKEGQKLMRIPDLRRMQVNTKVHEALVSRIRGDDRRSTGAVESARAAALAIPCGLSRIVTQSEFALEKAREELQDEASYIASPGQSAVIRVDAFPDRLLRGRVRSIAPVASSTDWYSSDVKVYQTFVLIDETIPGLKPGMNAEVTIQVDGSPEPVLAVPLQAVFGGSEGGDKRKVFVNAPGGPQEREVVLGKFNDRVIEVRQGLTEGDEVVLNPRAILGDKVKTREDTGGGDTGGRKAGPGGPGGEGKGKGKGKGGPGGMNGPPGGGMSGPPGGGGGPGGGRPKP